MSNTSVTLRMVRMPYERLKSSHAASALRPRTVAIALLLVSSASLIPMPFWAETISDKVADCVSSRRGSVSADNEISAIDQAGKRWELRAQKDRFFIVSFLAVVPDTAPTLSRAQAVSIQSMRTQFGLLGVGAVVIDASWLNRGSQSSQAERCNAWYDWHLDPIPLLADEDSSIARTFDVCSVPTTLLLDRSGRVLKRWDSMANAGGLAQEIQAVLESPTKARTRKPTSPAPLPSNLR